MAPDATAKVKGRKGRGRFRLSHLLVAFAITLALGMLASAVLFAAVIHTFAGRAAKFDLAELGQMPRRSVICDHLGREIGRLHGESRIPVALAEVSPLFIRALLAREDARFYDHNGVDVMGIARAAIVNINAGTVKQGASTITQQLARNTFPLGGRTFDRKLTEAMLARRIEKAFSKEQILEFYVNRIYFGSGQLGIEAASRAYFSKSAKDLTLSEGATLAGLIRSPNRLSPLRDLENARVERDAVLRRMVVEGFLPETEAEATIAEELKTNPSPPPPAEGWATAAVREELDRMLSEEDRALGGLRVTTTIDLDLQSAAEEALRRRLAAVESPEWWPHPKIDAFTSQMAAAADPTPYLQGAVVVVGVADNSVRAIVGGRDPGHSKLNRATQARRQVGSAFKPFVFAAAYAQRRLYPNTLISDDAIKPGEFAFDPPWAPANSDGSFTGIHPAEYALVKPRNTMTVRIAQRAGIENVVATGLACGVAPSIPLNPSISLGSFEATPLDLTLAYSVIARGGTRLPPRLIERIEDGAGTLIYAAPPRQPLIVLDPGAAWLTLRGLENVVNTGTGAPGRELGFEQPAAGKTGTTNDFKDAWFIGFTTSLVCGVWVGFDTPTTIMHRGYGGTLALPVWADILRNAPADKFPAAAFLPPQPEKEAQVCSFSGLKATPDCGNYAETLLLPETSCPEIECVSDHIPRDLIFTHIFN